MRGRGGCYAYHQAHFPFCHLPTRGRSLSMLRRARVGARRLVSSKRLRMRCFRGIAHLFIIPDFKETDNGRGVTLALKYAR